MSPIKAGLAESERLDDATHGFARQFQTSYPIPRNAKMTDVWTPVEEAILEAFRTGADVGPLLEDAAEEIRSAERWS